MAYLKTKSGILIIGLISLFAFLYFFTGVFGGTFINLTLNTNPDLESGLVAHYTFDGPDMDWDTTAAEVLDSSGNGNTGDVRNTVSTTSSVAGRIGQSFYFDGVNDHIRLSTGGALPIFGSFGYSIAAWVKGPSGQSSTKIYSEGDTNWEAQAVFDISTIATDKIRVRIFDDTSNPDLEANSTSVVFDNEWHHVLWTDNNGVGVLYVDGIQDATNFNYTQSATTPTNAVIGADRAGAISGYFNGIIDDVRVYSKVLTSSEAKRLYGLGATTKINKTLSTNPDLENGLVGHWTFDGEYMDISSTTAEVRDRSSSGKNGDWLNHATTTKPGMLGQAIEFDGTNDRISIEDGANGLGSLNEFTVGAWIYLPVSINTVGIDATIYQAGNTADNYWQFLVDNVSDELAIRRDDTGSTYRGSVSLEINEWQHVVAKKDLGSSVVNFYINGESGGFADINTATPASSGDKGIGARDDAGFSQFFPGTIDDVRLYNRSLSTTSIQRLYQLGATTKVNKTITTNPDLKNGLLAHFTYDGPDLVDNVSDVSGNGNVGYLYPGAGTTTRPGVVGQALESNGDTTRVRVASTTDLANLGPFSFATWIYNKGGHENSAAMLYSKDNEFQWYTQVNFSVPNARLDFSVNYDSADLALRSPNNVIKENEWQHIAVTWDGGDAVSGVKMYIDGVEPSSYSAPQDGSSTRLGDTNANIYFYNTHASNYNFNGLFDDTRIYSRVLSPAEVMRLYQLGN